LQRALLGWKKENELVFGGRWGGTSFTDDLTRAKVSGGTSGVRPVKKKGSAVFFDQKGHHKKREEKKKQVGSNKGRGKNNASCLSSETNQAQESTGRERIAPSSSSNREEKR